MRGRTQQRRGRRGRRWAPGSSRRRLAHPAAAALLAALLGCGSTGAVQQRLTERMRAGDYPGAIELVEDQRTAAYRGKNRLLYHLELGMLLHVAGEWAASNEAFERAKRVGDALYTRSLSREGLSLTTNDYALPYAGENFERTLIHLFSALNYQMLGRPAEAVVEARQVADYLRQLQVDTASRNVYREDAFARYLSALLFEAQGELDAALIDYKRALGAYRDSQPDFRVPPPESLLARAERVAARLGPWAQEDLARLGSDGRARTLPAESGEVVVLHYNGLAPVKDQTRITIPFSKAWLEFLAFQAAASAAESGDVARAIAYRSRISDVDLVSVAFPKFVDRPYSIERMSVSASGAHWVEEAELVQDIGAIARKDLQDRIARIRTKAIARAAIKYALQKGAEAAVREAADGDTSDVLGLLVQVTGNVARFTTEQADKRSWSTLPDEIWMASVALPAGTHELSIDFVDASRRVVDSRVLSGIDVASGRRRYVIVRTVR